jgi:hypothetical protein
MNGIKSLSKIELKFTGPAENSFEKALKEQIELHEGVTFIDLLKFLYQSSLGSFHIFEMMNDVQVKNWIREGINKVKPSNDPLIERLYGGKWVRLNLGAYKKKYGNDLRKLYEVFAKSKVMEKGELDEFEELLMKLVEGLRGGKIEPVTRDSRFLGLVEDFVGELRRNVYPPIHHSEIFMQKNKYEYLVIPSSSIDKLV